MIWYKQIFGPVAIALFRIVTAFDCKKNLLVSILHSKIEATVIEGKLEESNVIMLET